ncbi:MAG: multidrug MFS transporter [Gammaproteobacteria bacterium]|nr:MAG: multidrug MFS transporter [Gammaproteobacteria bacterium]
MNKTSTPFAKSTAYFIPNSILSKRYYPTAKTLLDICISCTALALIWPVLVLVALLIKLDSKGPILFAQQRVGYNGKHFTLLKFRTMHHNCESNESLNKTYQSDRAGICSKYKRDPRVTCIGRILRKLSIDEVPQLINVLRNEMSLVGPRPALVSEVEKYDLRALKRLDAMPGITGLWQISGRANLSFSEQIDLDLHYVEHANLWMDTKIIVLTIPAIIRCTGAY